MSRATNTEAPAAARSLHKKLFSLLGTDGEMALDKAAGLLDLASWIESARYVTEAVRDMAGAHAEVEQALTQADIRFNTASWGDEHVGGLLYLHMAIGVEINAARKAMQEALAASREGGR